ncbi:MAG: Ldh family oxidoreductase [Pseudomonadota bacterium]
MAEIELSLAEIESLVERVFKSNGCDDSNTEALVRTVVSAERDGCISHGLFRVPGYVASLRSRKVDGKAEPQVSKKTPALIQVDGKSGFAPLAIERGIPELASAAKLLGIGIMTIRNSHHFAALWPEVESLASQQLIGIACLNYMPVVAPFGGKAPLFGTNPIAFAWPRENNTPLVFDMATSAMAQGEVQIADRDGLSVPLGTGLDAHGNMSTNPRDILDGVLLPFGGYKGSAIALMVELLAAGATGDHFSYEAEQADNCDGGPPPGGELIIAISPEVTAGPDWSRHCEDFFTRFEAIDGTRLPGMRRHRLRDGTENRCVNDLLLERIEQLCRPVAQNDRPGLA